MYTSATEPKNTWSEHKPGDFRDLQNGQHKWTSFVKCFLCFAQLSCHIHIRWKHNGCYYYYCWLLQDGQQTTTWQVSWQTSIPQPPPHVPSIAKPSSRSSYCGCKSQIGFSSRLDDCKHKSGKNCWRGQCLLWLKKKKRHNQLTLCAKLYLFSLWAESLSLESQSSFFLGPTSLVFDEQVAGAERSVKCNTFFCFPFSRAVNATCTHSDCGDQPRTPSRGGSQYRCKISPALSFAEVFYRLSSFNVSVLSPLLLLRYLLILTYSHFSLVKM